MLTEADCSKLMLKELSRCMGDDFKSVGIDEPYKEAQYLICLSLDWDILQFLRSEEVFVPREQQSKLWGLFQRRLDREPMAYLVGEKEFYGRSFKVGPGALIPRPETEHLIEWVLESHEKVPYETGIDLCSGPGTVGLTLIKELNIPFSLVELSDLSMNYAMQNVDMLGCSGKSSLCLDDVTKQMNLEKVDLIVSNPPYVPTKDMTNLERDVREYEPHMALDGGGDGLDFLDKMMENINSIAKPGCHLYLELGDGQMEILKTHKFEGWKCDGWRYDLARIPRIVRYAFKSD